MVVIHCYVSDEKTGLLSIIHGKHGWAENCKPGTWIRRPHYANLEGCEPDFITGMAGVRPCNTRIQLPQSGVRHPSRMSVFQVMWR